MWRDEASDPYDPDGARVSEPSGTAVAIWGGVAFLALILALVALLFGAPDQNRVARSAAPAMADGEQIAVVGTSGSLGDPTDIAGEVARLRVENAALRNAIDVIRGQIDGLSDRLAALESSVSGITGSVTSDRLAGVPSRIGRDLAPGVDWATTGTASGEPHTLYGVELGSFRDLSGVRDAWLKIRRSHPEDFGPLQAVVTVRDRNGAPELLLVAGPFPRAEEAAALCGRMTDPDMACLPAFYIGQPL